MARPYGFDQPDQFGGQGAAPRQDLLDAIFNGQLDEQHLADLDTILGLQPPQELPPVPNAPEQSRGARVLQSFAGLENQQMRPRGFAQGLVSGLSSGLGSAGSRVAAQRAKLEAQIQERQQAREAANLAATKQYQQERTANRRGLVMAGVQDQLAANREDRKNAAENITVTPELLATAPKGSPNRNLVPGSSISRTQWNSGLLRDTASEGRAAAAAERQAAAAERQARLANVTSVNGLANEYRQDKQITGYTNLRSNLMTAEEASKQKSGPGDIAIVFSFMRALEPENPNAVREGEYTNARQATGAFQQALNLPSRYFKGNQLTDEGRQYFLTTMRGLLKSRRQTFDEANKQYEGRAKLFDVDPNLIIRSFPQDTTSSAPGNSTYRPKSWKPQ